MTKAMLMTALICGTMYCGTEPVHANELDTFALDEYVVTATRTPVKVFDANANISVVTRDEIENAHYDNLEEALRTVPGVQINDYNLPGYNTGSLRINGASNVVVLIDGVRANHGSQGFQAAYHSLDNVERVEVLKGAASTLYGADAKGGVINIITRKAEKNKSKITISGGDFSTEEYKLHNEGKVDTWSWNINLAKKKQGNIEDGSGKEWINDYDSENVHLKINKELGENSNLTVGYDLVKYDYLYENNPANSYYTKCAYGDGEEEGWFANWNQKINDTLSNTLAIRNSEYSYNYVSGTYRSLTNYKTLSVSDYLTKNFNDVHIVTTGFDFVRDEDMSYDYGKTYQRSIYLQDEWKFDNKWKVTAGIRRDDHSRAGSSTTSRVNLGYEFDENTNMYVGYNEFFVAPSIYYMTSGNGNPNLKPEEGENYEIGINHKFDDTLTMTAHVFKRETDSKIAFNSDTYRNENIGKEDAKGFDIQFSKLINNNLSIFTGYNYLHTEDDTYGDNHCGLFPRHTVNLGVNYDVKKFNAMLNARFALERGKGEGAGVSMLPDYNYCIVDMAVNYKPVNNIKIFAKVNNLFDKYYTESTDGNIPGWATPGEDGWYPMPGRTILIGAEYSF